MKKLKFTLVMALVAIFGCSQANAFLRFGVKAGLNVDKVHFSKSNWNETFNDDNRCGWTAGVTTEFTVPVIGIGMDLSLMYARMNSESPFIDGDGVVTSNKSAKNFLEIPLNLKYKLSLPAINRIVIPYIFTGPDLALKLGGKKDGYLQTKTAQWGWNLGLGVELIKHLQIGAGYTFGINNIVKFADKTIPGFPAGLPSPTDDVKIKNNYWTVTAAWMF
ncbi:MAG: PorT family protein [Muribaculaceae bacterium]|nr:PorT family protein [Muribaculaceae bacterium]